MTETGKIIPVQVNGKTFLPTVETTAEQDFEIMALAEKAGILDFAETMSREKIPMHVAAFKLVSTAYRSGYLFDLMGAMYVEEGKEWNIEQAAVNAKMFRNMKNKEEKEAVQGNLVQILFDFFVLGLGFSRTFRSYSDSPKRESVIEPPSAEDIATSVTSKP